MNTVHTRLCLEHQGRNHAHGFLSTDLIAHMEGDEVLVEGLQLLALAHLLAVNVQLERSYCRVNSNYLPSTLIGIPGQGEGGSDDVTLVLNRLYSLITSFETDILSNWNSVAKRRLITSLEGSLGLILNVVGKSFFYSIVGESESEYISFNHNIQFFFRKEILNLIILSVVAIVNDNLGILPNISLLGSLSFTSFPIMSLTHIGLPI